jgi:predicted DCC family thiol-disulfide oxidoreductase YuxK
MKYDRPVMLYDGDCIFCKRWIARWAQLTQNKVLYLTYQESLTEFPQLSQEDCQSAIQFIEPDGKIYSAAEGVLRSLRYTKHYGWLYKLYQRSSLFESIAETLYRWVARHRDFFTRIGL